MKKQLLLLMIMLLPMVANADDSGDCGDNLTWSFNESTKTLTISGTGGMNRYDNNTRKSPWYKYVNDIKIVIIEDGVTSIGECAFRSCSNLSSLTTPNSLTSVQDRAFDGCSLKSIYITSLEAWCNINFENSSSCPGCEHFYLNGIELRNIVIPNGITSLNGTFCRFKGLISISIPESVTAIGDNAFYYCINLPSITIPESATTIGKFAFGGCKNLTKITIPKNVNKIGYGSFADCSSLTKITIPDGVAEIEDYAFHGCSGLTNINIPSEVTYIGFSTFSDCSYLSSIIIPNKVTEIGDWAFARCSRLTSIDIPESVKSIGSYAFSQCNNLTSIIIPTGLTSIGSNAFQDCYHLSTIHISDISAWCNMSLSNIYSCPIAYAGCLYLNGEVISELVIPDDVSCISDYAFYNCKSITSITFPNQLKMVKRGAFAYCNKLTSLSIPASVEFIYQEAFANCDALESVKAKPSTPPFLYDDSFSNFSVPLEVPKGYKEEYQTAQGWENFTNISESDKGYYKLIYLVDNEEYKTYIIEEGSSVTPEAAPTKEGYTYSGWSEIPETMPAHDVTVTGSFFKKGDANGDNTVNAADILEVVNYIIGNPSEKFNNIAADMNVDGDVNAADIVLIINAIIKTE